MQSVLAGLPPDTVLEICSRSLAFWQYQMQQESTFQGIDGRTAIRFNYRIALSQPG
jgi:hypothetical protein